jgi:hypothetical protein
MPPTTVASTNITNNQEDRELCMAIIDTLKTTVADVSKTHEYFVITG